MNKKSGLLAFILAFVATAVFVSSAWAQQQRPMSDISDDEVNAIARKIYCPVCEGVPLDTCPTLACIDWRAEIRLQLAQGRTEAEIMDHFIRQYGDAVSAEPPRRGFLNWLIWLSPLLLLAVGGVVFGSYLRNIRQQNAASPPSPAPSSKKKRQPKETAVDIDDYIQRIEQEVNRDK